MSTPTPSSTKQQEKQARRDAAREQARKLREAQQRREKRNRLLIIGGVIAFVAIVAVALISILSSSGGPDLSETERPSTATEAGAIPVGADGAAGTVNEGAPTVDVYYDFQCPHCATFEATNGDVLNELAANGEATIEYHPISILDNSGNGSGFSTRGAQAVAVVAHEAPELFPEFNAALFDAQGPGGGVALTDEQIAEAAAEVGVPQDVIDNFGGSTFRDWVRAATTKAAEEGVTATPTIHINGEDFVGWQNPEAFTKAVTDAA